jgi:hypothetical protein
MGADRAGSETSMRVVGQRSRRDSTASAATALCGKCNGGVDIGWLHERLHLRAAII